WDGWWWWPKWRRDNIPISIEDTKIQRTLDRFGTWVREVNVYHPMTIPEGRTLTILPGTTVYFWPGAGISVEGTLEIKGTLNAPVHLKGLMSPLAGYITLRRGTASMDCAYLENMQLVRGTANHIAAAGCGSIRVEGEDNAILNDSAPDTSTYEYGIPAAVLQVYPPKSAMGIGDTLQYWAVARSEEGKLVSPGNLEWLIDDPSVGTISSAGLFRAEHEGIASVTIQNTEHPELVDTVSVHIISPDNLVILPDLLHTPQIAIGQEVTFSSALVDISDAYDCEEVLLDRPMTWQVLSGPGRITEKGEFSSETAGLATIIAQDKYYEISDTIQVEVVRKTSIADDVSKPDYYPKLTLLPNVPNPFNANTSIRFSLPKPGIAHLTVFNILGQRVRTLLADHTEAGNHAVVWNGNSDRGEPVASGIYFSQLESSGSIDRRKLLLLR
ncbi:MAG: FlgD immunoglobulin-like domain containing protein, partial [Candidatus Latescibacterota bacterium]